MTNNERIASDATETGWVILTFTTTLMILARKGTTLVVSFDANGDIGDTYATFNNDETDRFPAVWDGKRPRITIVRELLALI